MPEKYYIDIDYNLTKNTLSNDVSVKYDVNAIAQSIKNIVLTSQNEKIFNLQFGGSALSLSFEDLYPYSLEIMKRKITAAINLQEPRAIITNIDITDTNLGYWNIDITFTPIFDRTLIKTITISLE
jgi:phage baseplate assembly protein W